MGFNLQEITSIEVDGSVIDGTLQDGKLILRTRFVPEIVDDNFREIEMRLNQMDSTLQNLRNTINKMENKINILNAVMTKQ